jgi:inosine triphosphate pyrophosphatase
MFNASDPDNIPSAFVTGNYNKLKETKYILSQGTPVEIDSQDLDSKFFLSMLIPR